MLSTLRKHLYEWITYEPPSTEIFPYDFTRLREEIRPGDVVLVAGRSRVSRIIHTITQSPWTHAALYVGRLIDIEDEHLSERITRYNPEIKPNTRLVIEDLLDKGTVVTPLNAYRHHHIRICRPIGITLSDTELIIRFVIDSLGEPYNVRQLLDLARFLLPWSILPRRWGSSLFKAGGKPASGICSTLIARAFNSVQFPILPFIKQEPKGIELIRRNPYLYTPKDFDYSPYFDIIKYPLLYPETHLPYYRTLPWSKDHELYQDNGVLSHPKKKTAKRLHLFRRRPPDVDDHSS